MPLLVGIDEAGYGPLLGPLVVGATVWHVSADALAADHWQRLAKAVCRKPRRHDSRLPLDDSKQVFDRQQGITTLERTVLAFATAAGLDCRTGGDFLAALGAVLAEPRPPWYQDLTQSLPLDPVRSACELAADRLARSMAAGGVCCRGLLAQVVTETAYNRRVARTRNKAAVLLEQVLRLIERATRGCGDQDVWIHVDRLGGRRDYRPVLLAAFADRHLHVEAVGESCSRYRLATQRSDWTIDFTIDADRQHLSVALASMLAKYVREVLMQRFNAFWHAQLPALQPTAGYYTDAQRFLTDIRPVLAQTGLSFEQFVRER